jgi:hypothetical protein
MNLQIVIDKDMGVVVHSPHSPLPPPPSRPHWDTEGLTPAELQEMALAAQAVHNDDCRIWLRGAIQAGKKVRIVRDGNWFNVIEEVDPAAPEWQHVPEHLRGWLGQIFFDSLPPARPLAQRIVFKATRPEWRPRYVA